MGVRVGEGTGIGGRRPWAAQFVSLERDEALRGYEVLYKTSEGEDGVLFIPFCLLDGAAREIMHERQELAEEAGRPVKQDWSRADAFEVGQLLDGLTRVRRALDMLGKREWPSVSARKVFEHVNLGENTLRSFEALATALEADVR